MNNQIQLENRIENLDNKYADIDNQVSEKNELIISEIMELSKQISGLNKKASKNKIKGVEDKNKAVLSVGDELLHQISGSPINIDFYEELGIPMATSTTLILGENNETSFHSRRVAKSNISELLGGIANTPDLYKDFIKFSKFYKIKLNERKRTLGPGLMPLKGAYGERAILDKETRASWIRQINGQVSNINQTKQILSGEIKKVEQGLPSMLLKFCNLPVSEFSKENNLYLKENKDNYSILINNDKKFLPKSLLKKIETIKSKDYPGLIYLEVNKEQANEFSQLFDHVYKNRNRKFEPSEAFKDFVNKGLDNWPLFVGTPLCIGAIKIAYEWFDSWRTQMPVESLTGPLVAAGITAGVLTAGYIVKEGAGAIGDTYKSMQETKTKKGKLSKIVSNEDSKFILNHTEMTKAIASKY